MGPGSTIHAGSARQALSRLRFICQLADNDLPMSALNTLVSEAIDVVVHCSRTPDGPRVTEIVAVEDLAGGADATQFTVTSVFRRDGPVAPLRWSGHVPVRLERLLQQVGIEVRSLLDEPAGAVEAQA